MKEAKLTDYKNFWLIWLSCASKPNGMSLFNVQTEWGIRTNYLYHKEAGLGKPLFQCMIEQKYIKKEGKLLKPEFEWIKEHVKSRYSGASGTQTAWSPEIVINEKWPMIQGFIEKYHSILFDLKNLRVLYKDKEMIGRGGHDIFIDIFAYVLFSNMISFFRKYKADLVSRIASTIISFSSGKNLLNYIHQLNVQIGRVKDFPILIRDESELTNILCPGGYL